MKLRSEAFFEEAAKKLKIAKEELFKPAEDTVSYSVCKNAQFAIENYFKGYLVKNNVALESNETIATLHHKCVLHDKNFKEIDLTAVGCKNHAIDSHFCSEINSVTACFDAADTIDTYLRKKNLL